MLFFDNIPADHYMQR